MKTYRIPKRVYMDHLAGLAVHHPGFLSPARRERLKNRPVHLLRADSPMSPAIKRDRAVLNRRGPLRHADIRSVRLCLLEPGETYPGNPNPRENLDILAPMEEKPQEPRMFKVIRALAQWAEMRESPPIVKIQNKEPV